MSPISAEEIQLTTKRLQELIRIDTTNPPGNELPACQRVSTWLEAEGISCQILESAPGRANLVARLKGDGSQKPLLLTSHLDVVPAIASEWSVPPFSGEIRDDMIWGRGAVDMKQMTALQISLLIKAKRENLPLKRDLILAAVADEETGCELGSRWLVENHPDLISAEYALNEVGGFSLPVLGKTYYPVGVAERGTCWFEITARGRPGHGSMPHGDQAVQKLCCAIERLGKTGLPRHESAPVSAFLSGIANSQTGVKRLLAQCLAKPIIGETLLRLWPDRNKARAFQNMFSNLATPTKLSAGIKENVIPGEARATFDGRILPGSNIAQFLSEVQHALGPDFELKILRSAEPTEQNANDPFVAQLGRALKNHDPDGIPVPFLIPGFTDAHYYKKLGIKCYGFIPAKMPPDLAFGDLYHGRNERLPISALAFGLNVLWDVLRTTCC